MSLVTVDSDALAAIGPAVTALETEFENFVAALPAPPPAGSLDDVNAAIADFKSKLDAVAAPAAPATPADPTAGTGTDTGTGTTADPTAGTGTDTGTTTDGTGAPVDPATGAPVDPTA